MPPLAPRAVCHALLVVALSHCGAGSPSSEPPPPPPLADEPFPSSPLGSDPPGETSPLGDASAANPPSLPSASMGDASSAETPPRSDGGVACTPTDRRSSPVTVDVLPSAGERPYLDLLASAQTTIRVFGYLMGRGAILDTLKAKAQAGVDVRIILDGGHERSINEKYKTELETARATVHWSDPKFSYMHAKTMVVDGVKAVVSTGNCSRSYIEKERNYVATLGDPQDVGNLADLFDADWNQTSPPFTCTRLLISPLNARDRLQALLRGAQKTLDIESMELSDNVLREAIAERHAAGVEVRVLLADPAWISTNQNAARFLADRGIAARWLAAPVVHVKAIGVDGRAAYLGSENLSATSLDSNREIGIIATDAAPISTMQTTFEADWSAATPF